MYNFYNAGSQPITYKCIYSHIRWSDYFDRF